jgi:hypothetical protein
MKQPSILIGLTLSFAGLAAYSLRFYSRQNAGLRAGGPISPPKMLWLSYTLAAWFIVPFFLWQDAAIDPGVRRIFGWYLFSFLVRGIAEIILLYRVKHWTPIYGISHDLLCIGIVVYLRQSLPPLDLHSTRALIFSSSLVFGLIAEITFAGMFLQTRSAARGIYFASTEPHWRFINGVTTIVLLWAIPDFIATLIGLYGPIVHVPAILNSVRFVAGWTTAGLATLGLIIWTGMMRRPGAVQRFQEVL